MADTVSRHKKTLVAATTNAKKIKTLRGDYMTIQELKQIHNEVIDQTTMIKRYLAVTIDEWMKTAIGIENHASML